MIRGTTPTITFTAELDFSLFSKIEVTFAQHKEPIFTKKKEDCIINGKELTVKLTEAETLQFNCKSTPIQMQIVCGSGEERIATGIMETPIESLLKGECLE